MLARTAYLSTCMYTYIDITAACKAISFVVLVHQIEQTLLVSTFLQVFVHNIHDLHCCGSRCVALRCACCCRFFLAGGLWYISGVAAIYAQWYRALAAAHAQSPCARHVEHLIKVHCDLLVQLNGICSAGSKDDQGAPQASLEAVIQKAGPRTLCNLLVALCKCSNQAGEGISRML